MTAENAAEVVSDCERCADEYARQPGMAGSLTMIDLYRAVARLARIVESQQKTINHLCPDKTDDI